MRAVVLELGGDTEDGSDLLKGRREDLVVRGLRDGEGYYT